MEVNWCNLADIPSRGVKRRLVGVPGVLRLADDGVKKEKLCLVDGVWGGVLGVAADAAASNCRATDGPKTAAYKEGSSRGDDDVADWE